LVGNGSYLLTNLILFEASDLSTGKKQKQIFFVCQSAKIINTKIICSKIWKACNKNRVILNFPKEAKHLNRCFINGLL